MTQKTRRLLGLFGTFLFILGLLGYTDLYLAAQKIEESRASLPFVEMSDIPVLKNQVAAPEISATAAVAIDYDSGSVLYEKNADIFLPPASTTKLVTALVVREYFAPENELTIGGLPPVSGSMLGIRYGEKYSVADLLSAMIITSANDVALEFAAAYPGGSTAFVQKMNEKAQELGLRSTVFSNPAGFDFGQHHTTAFDLAKIARAAWADPVIREAMSTRSTSILELTTNRTHLLQSTNQLLHKSEIVLGGKTGTTEKAGEVLIEVEAIGEHTILTVVLNSIDRYIDTTSLTNWIAEAYTWKKPTPPHQPKQE